MMKMILRIVLFSLVLNLTTLVNGQTFDDYRSVMASATVNADDQEITLTWNVVTHATSYAIYRRTLGSDDWGDALATLGGNESTYTDQDVLSGLVYEYAIIKITNVQEPFASSGTPCQGSSYIAAAIDRPAQHDRGSILLLITDTINRSLTSEIETMKNDMVGDGWNVYTVEVTPSQDVEAIRDMIWTQASGAGCDAVLMLGNVPVPYSGNYCSSSAPSPPDGHNQSDANSHCGAWPADVYYGAFNGSWTDGVTNTLAKRAENDNVPGDGKFDNVRIPGMVNIAVGRIDLSRLPTFSETEIELTRRYLNKLHEFKMAQTNFVKKAVVENNFSQYGEGFASGSIHDFAAHVGETNIVKADIFTTTANAIHQFSYGAGAGWYTSCSGYGNTASFTTRNPGLFSYIFGSFFGDYDIADNFMRASLAANEGGLVCTWSGRPKWITHTLAIGENFADVTLRTQNNYWDYDGLFFQNAPHISLLGDVTLRTDMIAPVTINSLEKVNNNANVKITWNSADLSGEYGYYVYRSHHPERGFVLMNNVKTTDTSMIDIQPYEGTNYYMVRVAQKTTTSSGTYDNLSIGIKDMITGVNGQLASVDPITEQQVRVYPSLAHDIIIIERETAESKPYSIVNGLGQEVASGDLLGKQQTLNVSGLAPGGYIIRIGSAYQRFIKE